MSNFPFLDHRSPTTRKNPLAAQGVMTPNAHPVAQPVSVPKSLYKQQSSPNIHGFRNIQPSQWISNVESKRRDVSPIRYNPQEEKPHIAPQYNFQPIVQKRDSVGLAIYRMERTPQHIRMNRDISPIGKSHVHNEGVEYPPRAVRIDNRGMRVEEREGAWIKLLNRSQEQAVVRNQQYSDWKKVLDEQVKEKQMKKQIDEERRRIQEAEEENRYQRQIEELSSEINKKRINLQRSGVLKQEPQAHPNHNASPLGQLNSNVNNMNTKSLKDLQVNRELVKGLRLVQMPKNIREIRGKGNKKEEDLVSMSYSIEKQQENRSRNEGLNQYIDSIKAELMQGQEVFKNHMSDLKQEVYKLGKFRNLAERNLYGGVGIGKGGAGSLPSHLIYKDVYDESATPSVNTVELPVKSIRIKPPAQEEKFKWDTDDFYSKLPPSKQLVTGKQTMVKIEPVTEELLAYKAPDSPIKRWLEEQEDSPIEIQKVQENIKEEEKVDDKHEKSHINNIKPTESPAFFVTDLPEAKPELDLAQKKPEDMKLLPSISSIPEVKDTPKAHPTLEEDFENVLKSHNEIKSKPETQISVASPRNVEKAPQQDYLQITKNFQPLSMMLKNSKMGKDGTVTPSIEDASRRDQVSGDAMLTAKLSSQKDRNYEKTAGTGPTVSTNEDAVIEKESVKVKRPVLVAKEMRSSGVKNRDAKTTGVKNNGTLKALSKFVAKDELAMKIEGNDKLQKDPLARLDFMIDYLFNYNP